MVSSLPFYGLTPVPDRQGAFSSVLDENKIKEQNHV